MKDINNNRLVVWCAGGTGNQLFQYALYRELQSMEKSVALDISWFDSRDVIFSLNRFSCSYDVADMSGCPDYITDPLHPRRRIQRKLGIDDKNIYFEKYGKYDESVFLRQSGYIEGYFQNEKYFSDIRKELINEIKVPDEHWDKDNLNKKKEIAMHKNSVSVHIRRGDYIKDKYLGGIATDEYFMRAVSIIREQVETPHFFVFSDDLEYCKNLFKDIKDVSYIDGNIKTPEMDIMLIAECRHHIMSNSSFSWWGTYLSSEGGVVIAPDTWTRHPKYKDYVDIWLPSWIRI